MRTGPTFDRQEFRKASLSQPDGNCIEIARRGGWVEVRDSKQEFGAATDTRLVFQADEFDAFLDGARGGELAAAAYAA
jgi:Domain of unknown function (DUF397)